MKKGDHVIRTAKDYIKRNTSSGFEPCHCEKVK